MITWLKAHRQFVWYLLGLCIASLSLIPYFILKENIWVPFHDQLDGEVPNYMYQAKYLFRGSMIPEVMNGIPKTGMLPPAPFGVLLFCMLPPFWAYVSLQVLVTIGAYTGMFLLVTKVTGDCRIGFLCGCLFDYLPFMPVYGLSIAGQPLLWYALIQLYEKRKVGCSLLLLFLYAGLSSFALVGFAVCGVVFVFLLILAAGKKLKEKWQVLIGFLILCVTYGSFNISLFLQLLSGMGDKGVLSHRTEFVLTPISDYFGQFKEIFFGRGIYTPAYAEEIFVLTIVLVLFCIFTGKKKWVRLPLALVGTILAFTVAALVWDSALCMNTLRKLGPLTYFQANRISWLIPPLWYLVLGLDFKIILQGKRKLLSAVGYGSILAVCTVLAIGIYEQSFFYHQLRQVVFPDTYQIMTWKQYYADDIFSQIDENIGREKSEYRVVSLGMSPAAALYHGFYCLDGYSNNYPLEYKHTFRKVMEKELEKSEATRLYFDEWGNRCYLMSAESGGAPMIGKFAATAYQNLEIDVEQLKSMGCEYLFSAMEIVNAQDLNMTLEGVYETPSSYYKVYVYQL